jgi:hypothetical protein
MVFGSDIGTDFDSDIVTDSQNFADQFVDTVLHFGAAIDPGIVDFQNFVMFVLC